MEPRIAKAYADIALDSCLGLREGGKLRVVAEIAHRSLVHAIAEGAWQRGAAVVRVDWNDTRLSRLFFDKAQDIRFDEVPSYIGRDARCFVDEGFCNLSLVGDEDPTALDGVDPGKLQRQQRARSTAMKPFRDAVMSNGLAWSVMPVATEAWGRAVLSAAGRDPGPDPEQTLWEVLIPILGLDRPDHAAAIRTHMAELAKRAALLVQARFSEIHFTGPGTDLSVGLSPLSRWTGGASKTRAGATFYANHPTEEVFSSPDARLTRGRASCTRPVKVLGETVEGAWFEFRDGRVVASGAAKGAAVLARYLEVDEGSRRLGEVALVDSTGPIWKSGLVFDNGLIDENATCHIALGSAYTEVFEGAAGMDAGGRKAVGFNDSMVHLDFMIGSDQVEIEGLDSGGHMRPIIKDGKFVA